MRRSWRILYLTSAALGTCVGTALPGAAQQESQAAPISREAFFAAAAASGSRTAILPPLTYWGVRGAAWGAPAGEVQRIAPGMAGGSAAAGSTAPAAARPRDPECVVGGLRCESSVETAAGGLAKVQYRFATGVTDRRTRLGMYRTLMSALRDTYGDPSRHVRPQEIVQGEDAYVQGLDPRYEIQWSGPETNVALALTDRDLMISLTPAARGKAAVRERELSSFRQQIQALPAGHSMKKMISE